MYLLLPFSALLLIFGFSVLFYLWVQQLYFSLMFNKDLTIWKKPKRQINFISLKQLLNVLNGLYFWTNSVLLFSCFVYTIDFTANLAIFIMGIPFVIMLIVNIPDKRKEYLLSGTNQSFTNGEYILHYIAYYL